MTRFVLVLAILASATCGPRVTPLIDLPKPGPDAGMDDDGGLNDAGVTAGLDCRPCDTWGPVQILAPVPMDLVELSGLAASAAMPGVFYAHNDSGDTARLFAFGMTGILLAELRLPGASATDWEDMALGPCEGGGSCLFLADIGDNLRVRGNYVIYRSREPDLRAVQSGAMQAPVRMDLTFDRLPFVYPNGQRHNAETLLSHPVTGDLYIVTKEPGGAQSGVFRFPRPFTPGTTVTLIDLGEATVPAPGDSLVTGGDISPCGDAVILRMYNRNAVLRAAPDAGFESAFTAMPLDAPTPIDEPQGEAIVWGLDGQSYFSASEGSGQSLHGVRCARP